MRAQIAATGRSSWVGHVEHVGSPGAVELPLTDANRRLVADGERATKFRGAPALRPTAWASPKSIVTCPRQLPAMLMVSTDPLSAAKSAAKATADASTRSHDDPRSTT